MLQKGEGTTTDVLETQSKHAIAQAHLIETQDNLAVAQLKLEKTPIGQKITKLDRLSDLFNYRAIQLQDYDSWYALAMDRNAEVATQRHLVTSGRKKSTRVKRGMCLVSIWWQACRVISRMAPIIAGREFQLGAAGIEVNIPLYSGGRVNALTTQARANHARAEAESDAARDKVMVELRKQYNLLQSGIKRIESLQLGVKSAELLVSATEKSIRGGIRIN